MITLVAVRLIQWYHWEDETFRFAGHTLLTGANGSGKSTVLDAIQLGLVANMLEVRFNKAANEQSSRDLQSYILFNRKASPEGRPGEVILGRQTATTYVMLEFRDAADGRLFTAVSVLEGTKDERTPVRAWAVLDNYAVDTVEALDASDRPKSIRDFKQWVKREARTMPTSEVREYQEQLRQRLGNVSEPFHHQIARGLQFKPVGNLRDFIFNYLADERPIETAALLENLDSCKKLEVAARDAITKIAALRVIVTLGEEIRGYRDLAAQQSFVTRRAALERARVHVDGLTQFEAALCDEETTATRHAEVLREEATRLQQRLDDLNARMAQSEAGNAFRQAQTRLSEVDRDLKGAREDAVQVRTIVTQQQTALEALVAPAMRQVRDARPEWFTPDTIAGRSDAPETMQARLAELTVNQVLLGQDLRRWREALGAARGDVGHAVRQAQAASMAARAQRDALAEEQRELKAGRPRYDDAVMALRAFLATRLRHEPTLLCEVLEVPDERWRDAVEGWLGVNRTHLLVPAGLYDRAAELYEQYRDACPRLDGRGTLRLFGVGIIDGERLRADGRSARPGSLAAKVATQDPVARAYVDRFLGDVMCCERVQELRSHQKAVTPTCMAYSGFVVRRMNPAIYERHYLGRAAAERRAEQIVRELTTVDTELKTLQHYDEVLRPVARDCADAENTINTLPRLVDRAGRIRVLENEAAALEREIKKLETGDLFAQEEEIRGVRKQKAQSEEAAQKHSNAAASAAANLGNVRPELEAARQELEATQAALDCTFPGGETDPRWIEHRARWEQALGQANREAMRTPAASAGARSPFAQKYSWIQQQIDLLIGVHENYERQASGTKTRADNLVHSLVGKKTMYATEHHRLIDGREPEDVSGFVAELELWEGSKLPQYTQQIADARARAQQQIAEDIIYQLGEHLRGLQQSFVLLNKALAQRTFGTDRYKFTHQVNEKRRDLYELIVQAAAAPPSRDGLAATIAANPALAETLTQMVARMTSIELKDVKTELDGLTDYREYYVYDLEVHHPNNTISYYNRSGNSDSGGETQTPYYIAVLASMWQMYRAGQRGRHGTRAGVVLLDEAFNKMDERLTEVIQLATELGLQLVMATPPDKAALLAPLVETCFFIHTDRHTMAPSVMDYTKELVELYGNVAA